MSQRRTIANHAASEAFEPWALRALTKLGYQIVPAESAADPSIQVDLRIVDEESLGEVPGEEPIVLLAREPGLESSDLRVVTLLLRPATLNGLYTVLQSALERTPRRAPRISTSLSARCWQNQWFQTGTVSSLSETGCLFRSSDAMSPEPEVTLVFPLPSGETVSTRTRPISRGRHNVAFAFDDLPHESRSAIGRFVMGRLSA